MFSNKTVNGREGARLPKATRILIVGLNLGRISTPRTATTGAAAAVWAGLNTVSAADLVALLQ